jgi:hypothetical protein
MVYSDLYANFFSFCQQVGLAFSALWRFRPVRWYWLAILIEQVGLWWAAILIFRTLTGDILVLHYNVNFGIDLIGAPGRIFVYPALALGVVVVHNLIIAWFHKHRDFKIFTHLLLAAAINFGLIIGASLFFIYFINFK